MSAASAPIQAGGARLRRRRVWFALITLGWTTTLAVLAAELVVRLTWSRAHPRQEVQAYSFDPDVGITHVPGAYRLPFRKQVVSEGGPRDVLVRFSINAAGFRGPQFRDPPGKPLVAVLGDSMIEAKQVDDDKVASRALEDALRRSWPGVEVRNYGITSAGFPHYYARWRKFIKPSRPDVLVVCVTGVNDYRNCSTRLERFDAMRPYYEHQSGVRGIAFRQHIGFRRRPLPPAWRLWVARITNLFETKRMVRWTLTAVAERVPERLGSWPAFIDLLVYQSPLQGDFQEAVAIGQELLGRLIREARAEGSKVLIVYVPWSAEVVDAEWDALKDRHPRLTLVRDQPARITREVAGAANAPFISLADAARVVSSSEPRQLWHVVTDGHLSEKGNELLGQFIAEHVAALVDKDGARTGNH